MFLILNMYCRNRAGVNVSEMQTWSFQISSNLSDRPHEPFLAFEIMSSISGCSFAFPLLVLFCHGSLVYTIYRSRKSYSISTKFILEVLWSSLWQH